MKLALLLLCICSLEVVRGQDNPDPRTWSTPETITRNGYPNEIHWIVTEDGYILQVHRITGSRNQNVARRGLPVILAHSLCSSSFDYIAMGPDRALGYLLADNGFDVWLLNNRGNAYSTNHTTLDPNDIFDRSYWDFSWHQMGIYDLPATIDYIVNHTNHEQVYQVGHSEGCTQYYVMLAERPEYNARIRAHFSYAPATFLCHSSNVPTLILTFPERFGLNSLATQLLGSFSVIPSSELYSMLTSVCPLNVITESFCGSVYTPFANSNAEQQDRTVQPVILTHSPSGCSSRTLVHYTQSVRSCGFGEYQKSFLDERVEYNLTNVRAPLYVYYSSYDRFVDSLDILHLNDTLPSGFTASSENDVLGHADFVFGTSARRLLYDDTIARMISLSNN